MRQNLKIGVTVLVVAALAMTGIALAQTSNAPTTDAPPDADRLEAAILERLAPLVDDGTITDDQAEAVAAHLADAFDRPFKRRPGPGVMARALEFLGVTPEEAREALGEGRTLADIAEANGSSGDELVEFLLEQIESRLDEAVAEGDLTEERKAEIVENAEQRLTALVDGKVDLPRPHDRRRGPHRGTPGFGPFGEQPPFDGEA